METEVYKRLSINLQKLESQFLFYRESFNLGELKK